MPAGNDGKPGKLQNLENIGFSPRIASFKKIKIASQVSLGHVLGIQLQISSRRMRRGGLPSSFASLKLFLRNVKMDTTPGDIEFDSISGLDPSQWATGP
jgi:hypothetical protein